MSKSKLFTAAASLLALAACHRAQPVPIAVAPEPAPAIAYAPPPPPPISPINRNLSQAATVWHFRVALNVAALACRGADEAAIIAGYNAMLKQRVAVLGAAQTALSAEYRARGGDWQDAYDDAMTRLYNFFSQAQARDDFCAIAASTLNALPGVLPEATAQFAAERLPLLDAPFARMLAPQVPAPVIAYAATPAPAPVPPVRRVSTPVQPPRAVPAAAAAPAAPRLAIDMRALDD